MKDNYKDIFKKHFEGHEDEIDPQIIWDKVRPKKERKSIWIFVGPILLGVLVLFGINKWQNQDDSILAEHKVVKDKKQGSIVKQGNNLRDTKDLKKAIKARDIIKKSQTKLNPKENEVAVSTEVKTFTEVKEINNNVTEKSKSISKQLPIENSSKTELEDIVLERNQTEEVAFETRDLDINAEQKLAANEPKLTLEQNKVPAQNEIESKPISSIISMAFINNIAEIKNERTKYAPDFTFAKQGKQAKENKNKAYWSFAANGTYGFLNASLETKSDSPESLALTRNETVDQLEAARTQLLWNYHVNKRLSFSSGLAYTRLNELFAWRGSYVEETYGTYVESVTMTHEGTFVNSVEGEYEEKIVRNMRIYNKTNLVSVPVMVNLHQGIGNFSVLLSGGIEANFMNRRDGYILDEDSVPVKLQDQDSRFGLNYLGALGLEYKLNENLSLTANMSYIVLNQEEQSISTNYLVKGIGLGARYSFR